MLEEDSDISGFLRVVLDLGPNTGIHRGYSSTGHLTSPNTNTVTHTATSAYKLLGANVLIF